MSRPEDPCCDIKTPLQLEVCRNIEFLCCNQVSSSIKHHLSRPKLLLQHLFMSQQAFPCCRNQCRDRRGFYRHRESAFNLALCCNIIYFHPSRLAMFFPFSVVTYCLLSRQLSFVIIQTFVLRHMKCCCDTVPLTFAWKFFATHQIQSQHRLLQLLFFSYFLLEFSPF